MRPVPGLTLCGKRINQHCDTDKDMRISQTEWTICLGVAKGRYLSCSFSKNLIMIFQKKRTRAFHRLHYDLWGKDEDPIL